MKSLQNIRDDFPALHQEINGHPLIYLDNAATSQKPWQVIEALRTHYEFNNANVHRGIHTLSDRATRAYEGARDKIVQFINASSREEVIFVRGATEGINIVSQCFIAPNIQKGDAVVISELEHHSNIVPWQLLEKMGLEVRWLPVNDKGEMVIDDLAGLLNGRVKLVAINAISNSLGTVSSVKTITDIAHQHNIPVLVDACQVPAHAKLDVQEWDCDFCVFSSHKAFGPTGTGILYGKKHHLENMPPWLGGGDMISEVRFDGFEPNDLPYKFEAGTPNIADVIAFGVAIDYISNLSRPEILAHETNLLNAATDALQQVPGLEIVGTSSHKTSVLSFYLPKSDLHPADIGALLDKYGIAIRAGHHCTMPILAKYGLPATARASFSIYNTVEEAHALGEAMQKIVAKFS